MRLLQWFFMIVAFFAMLLMVSPVKAVRLLHDGQEMFYDDFSDDTPIVNASDDGDPALTSPPNVGGSWDIVNDFGTRTENLGTGVQVTTPAFEGIAGANTGSNFLALTYRGTALAKYDSTLSTGTVGAQFAFYLPEEADQALVFTFHNTQPTGETDDNEDGWPLWAQVEQHPQVANKSYLTNRLGSFGHLDPENTIPDGHGVAMFYDGGWNYFTDTNGDPLLYSGDAWHEVDFSYDLDSTEGLMSLSIDDVASGSSLPSWATREGQVVGFAVATNAGGMRAYIDAVVPEPSALCILFTSALTACVLFVTRRCHKLE